MYSAQNDMEMVECPYNKSHRMLRKRLQSHIIKCRVNHTDVELQKCPFNNTHLIPEPEFVHHVTNCSDRKLITQYKYNAPVVKDEDRPKQAPVESNENWDDTEVEDYNPLKFAETTHVLRRPNCVSSSERKAVIKNEEKMFGECSSGEEDTPQKPPTPPPPQWNAAKPSPTQNFRDRSRSPNVYRSTKSEQFECTKYNKTRYSPDYSSESTKFNNTRHSPDYSLDDDPYYSSNYEKYNQQNNREINDIKDNELNNRHYSQNSIQKINLPSCTKTEKSDDSKQRSYH